MLRQFFFAATFFATSLLAAQTSVVHCNTGLILESLAESAVADSLLSGYQDSLAMGFKLLEDEFLEKVKVAQDPDKIANMTRKQQEQLQQELQEMQQQAEVYQQEAARMFEQRRIKYLQPLVDRVRLAIEAYAKTNNIQLVLDTSIGGVMVYADDTKDITEAMIALVNKTTQP